jgi:hypothetical protein
MGDRKRIGSLFCFLTNRARNCMAIRTQIRTRVDSPLRGLLHIRFIVRIGLEILVRFAAHAISRTIRIGAYFDFKLDTIYFYEKYYFWPPIRSGRQQLTSGFSGANIGMASAQLGGQ